MQRTLLIVAGTIFVLLLGVGIWSFYQASFTHVPDAARENLVGTDWILESLDGAPILRGTNITLALEPLRLRGYAGCNWYGGEYKLENGALTIPMLTKTVMGCTRPKGVMEQEDAFVQALQASKHYVVLGERLTLTSIVPPHALVFRQRKRLAMDPAQLIGTQWQLIEMKNAPPLPGSKITLAFDQIAIQGDAGCRNYSGTYQAESDHFQLVRIEMQGGDCSKPEIFWQQEGEYTTLLSEARYYRMTEQTLELETEAGGVLRFQRLRSDSQP